MNSCNDKSCKPEFRVGALFSIISRQDLSTECGRIEHVVLAQPRSRRLVCLSFHLHSHRRGELLLLFGGLGLDLVALVSVPSMEAQSICLSQYLIGAPSDRQAARQPTVCPRNLSECANGRLDQNRPLLELSPLRPKVTEPVTERGTAPVSSSTRTVARASSPNRARKGVDDGTN